MSFISYLKTFFTPTKKLAALWDLQHKSWESHLRASGVNPSIVDALLGERERIESLFHALDTQLKGRLFVIITNNTSVESCAVCLYKQHYYILVSAALIGRPYDFPENPGLKRWLWLAAHEFAHIKENHLPWLHRSRQAFQLVSTFFLGALLLSWFFPVNVSLSLYSLSFIWFFKTFLSLFFEIRADLFARKQIKDLSAQNEAAEGLVRMTEQTKAALGLQYYFAQFLSDPHPPLALRLKILLSQKLS